MKENSKIYYHKSIRLKGYDYSQGGYYFITICTENKKQIFGKIENNEMILNECGNIVKEELLISESIRPNIKIDYHIIMPNHIHFIMIIEEEQHKTTNVAANSRSPLRMLPKSLSSFIAGFKSKCTKRINEIRNTPRLPLWQRNYFEHIIRNEHELFEIRQYIKLNSINWEDDDYNK